MRTAMGRRNPKILLMQQRPVVRKLCVYFSLSLSLSLSLGCVTEPLFLSRFYRLEPSLLLVLLLRLFFLFWMIASDLSNTFQDNSTRRCKLQQLVIGAKDERERVLEGDRISYN